MQKTRFKKTQVTEISCRTALSPSGLPEFDYTLNPYRGCLHGCKYCYAPNILRIPREKWGSFLEVKRNIPSVLSKELKNKMKGTVGISTATDPYQPPEEDYELTRLCLKQLARYDFPVSIITKSPLVTRDLDILRKFTEAEVGLTITTLSDSERRTMEPYAPKIESRIAALERCNKMGIRTYAFLGPLYPTMGEGDLERLIRKLSEAGVSKITADRLNLRPGVWSSIEDAFHKDPETREIWRNIVFRKDGYHDLFSILQKICNELDIRFEMQEF